MGYKKLSRKKRRRRVSTLDQLIAQKRAQLDPIENSRVDNKLLALNQPVKLEPCQS